MADSTPAPPEPNVERALSVASSYGAPDRRAPEGGSSSSGGLPNGLNAASPAPPRDGSIDRERGAGEGAASEPPAVDFTLRFLDGRGLLGLRAPLSLGFARVEKLELEVPNLRFPFDLSGGAARFQSRRCRFREARVRIDEDRIAAYIASRDLARYGVHDLSLRIGEGKLFVAFEARLGERHARATARVRVEATGEGASGGAGRGVRLVVSDVRLYGWVAVPAPLVGMALLLSAGAQPETGAPRDGRPVLGGLADVEIDPLETILWRTLVPNGWRLPSRGAARVSGIRLASGHADLALSDGSEPPRVPDLSRCPKGDEALMQNDVDRALALYRAAWQDEPHPQLFDRILSLLVASPSRWDEALAFAAPELERRPAHLGAQLAAAAIEVERGQTARAAARYAELAALAKVSGEAEDEVAALERAAELFVGTDVARATPLLERLLVRDPKSARAQALLADCYRQEHRYGDLARLEATRVSLAVGGAAQAAAHTRLAEVLLDHLAQPSRAKEELERAVRLHTYDARAWLLLGRAYAVTSERDRAIGAFDAVVALSPDPGPRAEAHVRAAQLLASDPGAPDVEAALARFQAALAIDPQHGEALAGEAELYRRTGRFEDASQVFERSFAAIAPGAPGDPRRRQLLVDEATRAAARGSHEESRRLLERALEYGEDTQVLAKLAERAEADGRWADAERALARLSALGDGTAPLRRARALLALGDAAPARAIAESLLAPAPSAPPGTVAAAKPALTAADRFLAERIVADAARAQNDERAQRAALERLLTLREDPELRVEVASLAMAEGDVEVAERHLAAAGEHRAALELKADLLEARGDDRALDETLSRLVRALEHDDPGRARALLRQGALRARRERHAEALECFRAAAALLPDGETEEADAVRAGLGRSAYVLGRWDEARAAWEPLHDRGVAPRAQRALRLGEIAVRQRDPVAAARFYRGALDQLLAGADVVRAWESLIAIADGRGDTTAAVQALVEAADDQRTGESAPVRAGRLVAAAGRLMARDEREGAAQLLERALGLDPAHQGALDALEQAATRAGDPRRLADVLARRAASPRARPAERRSLLLRLAAIQEHHLSQLDAARETHARVLELDPDARASNFFLAQDARRAGDRETEERLLARFVTLPGERLEPAHEAEAHARLSQLFAEAGHDAQAEREARRALELSPRQPQALAVLDEVLSRSGRIVELEPILAVRAEVEPGFEAALDVDYRRAAILEKLGRAGDAIAVYDRIVRVRPNAASAWERLAALHREAGAWKPLLEVLGRLASRHAAAGQPEEAAAVCVEMAHLAHDRLSDLVIARRSLSQALSYDPRCALALDGLLSLARAAGNTSDEDGLLARRIEVEDDAARRELLILERARARTARGDTDGALEVLAPVPLDRASDALLRLRAGLEEQRAAAGDAADALKELWRRARSSGDADAEREPVRRLVKVAIASGRQGPAIEALLRRALELDPDDLDAAGALAAISRGRDPATLLEALETLLAISKRRPAAARDTQREADLAVDIATVLRAAGDPGGAAQRLKDAIAARPDRVDARIALAEVMLDLGEADEAIACLEESLRRHPDRAAWALLGQAYEAKGDVEKTAAAYEAAGDAADPARRAAALERADRGAEALALWRRVGGATGATRAAAILLSRAQLAHAAEQPAQAARMAAEALLEGPCDLAAVALLAGGLDADSAWATLEQAAERRTPQDAAALWREAGRVLPDPARGAALTRAVAIEPDARSLAALARIEGGEAGAARARRALQLDPGCVPAALALAALSKDAGVLPALRAAYRRAEPADRPALSVAAGDHLRERARDPAAARDAYARALKEGATGEVAAAAHRALSQLDIETGDEKSALGHLRTARDAGLATADDLRRLAELAGEAGLHDEAIAALRGAGGPTHLLARALEAAERNEELVELLEHSAQAAPPSQARAALLSAAVVCGDKLGDPRRAAALLERAVPLGPADADLWVHLGRLYAGPLADGERAAAAYARAHAADPGRTDVLVPLGDFHFAGDELEPAEDYYRLALENLYAGAIDDEARAERARLHLRLADIAKRRNNLPAEEAALHAAAADGAPSAWSRLADHYRTLGDDARRAEALLAWAECDPDRRAQLWREARPLVTPDEAARLDEQILRLDAGDEAARVRVLGRLRAAGDELALSRRLVEEAARAPEAARAGLWLEAAEVRERIGDDDGALEAWSEALVRLKSLDVARRLVAASRRAGRGAQAARAIEHAFQGGPLSSDPRVMMWIAEAWLLPGGERDRATPWIDRVARGGAPRDLQSEWRALLRAAGRLRDLVADLDAEAARRTGPLRAQLELQAAEIVEDQLGDAAGAALRFARAFESDPAQLDVAAHARDLFLASGDHGRALALVEREIAAAAPAQAAALQAVRQEIAREAERARALAQVSRSTTDGKVAAQKPRAALETIDIPLDESAWRETARASVAPRGSSPAVARAASLPATAGPAGTPSGTPSAAAAGGQASAVAPMPTPPSAADPRRTTLGVEAVPIEAVRRDDPRALYATLKSQLDRLPRDAVERITDLRQRLGDLARKLDEKPAARAYYELVLAQHPERAEALRPLVDLYAAADEWERCADVLARLSSQAKDAAERAQLTYREAEVRRVQLGDEDGASAGYLKAVDYHPEHAPSLRRLIAYYFAEGDSASLGEILAELDRQREPFDAAAVEAGLAYAILGDEARAAKLLSRVDATRLAQSIGSIRAATPAYIDGALRAAARALAGTLGRSSGGSPSPAAEDPLKLAELAAALDEALLRDPARLGARAAAARLAERTNDVARARAHLAILAWVDPDSDAARHLLDLPPPVATAGEEPVHPDAAGPLREAMRLLGPLTIGVGAPLPGAEPAPEWGAHLSHLCAPFGLTHVDAAVVDEQVEPAWPEPTSPPRILVRRDLLDDGQAVAFAAARALHLLVAGVPVVEDRPEEELLDLLTAAAALFDETLPVDRPMARAWLAALRALPFHPEGLPQARRAAARDTLLAAARSGLATQGPAYCVAERYTADRVAFLATGDLAAGFRAIAPDLSRASSYEGGPATRARALGEPGPVRELSIFALSPEGLRRLGGLG